MARAKKVAFNVMNTLDFAGEILKKSKFKPEEKENFPKGEFAEAIDKLAKYFGTSGYATWILTGIIFEYFGGSQGFRPSDNTSMGDIADFFNISPIKLMGYREDILSLMAKGYIKNERTFGKSIGRFNSFSVNPDLINCLLQNQPLCFPKEPETMTLAEGLEKLADMLEDHNDFTKREGIRAMMEMEELFFKGKKLKEIRKLLRPRGSRLQENLDSLLFYAIFNNSLQGDETRLLHTVQQIYNGEYHLIMTKFLKGTHPLLQKELVELCERETAQKATVTLTQKALEIFLGAEEAKMYSLLNSEAQAELLKPEEIKVKELFYNKENTKDIERLYSFLNEENLRKIGKRLEEQGFAKGIAVLLYGPPGTGKTETVLQLARATGRAVLHVDISDTKSCWFGESEKIIRKIFTDYRRLCEVQNRHSEGKAPILLFNEADAVLSKRKDISSSNVAQTENAIQNVILEEMEKLKGVMIATTNMIDNLDAAFERRFLFKIMLDKPSVEAKRKIWASRLPWLNSAEVDIFAKNYNFSGGQIDNIVRKITMEEILSGQHPSPEELAEYCRHEKLDTQSAAKPIGF